MKYLKKITVIAITFFSLQAYTPFFATSTSTQSKPTQTLEEFQATPHEAGVYPVKIYDENREEEVIILVTVVYPKTVESVVNHEIIDAKDVNLGKDQFMKLSDAELIAKANVKAWNNETATPLEVKVKSKSKLAAGGVHQVVFTTEKGTAITVSFIEVAKEVLESGITLQEYVVEFDKYGYQTPLIMMMSALIFIPLVIMMFLYFHTSGRINKVKGLLDIQNDEEKDSDVA